MNIVRLTFVAIPLLWSLVVCAQNERTIGFACGEAGAPSSIVIEMEELIKDQNIDSIGLFLYSEEVAEMVLAKVVLEYFVRNEQWQIDQRIQQRIHKIHSIDFIVPYCSGCSQPMESITIRELDPTKCELLICSQIQTWLEEMSRKSRE
jgi:hypothetical protein